MTEERKKYFASISKEERVIRDTITALECGISIDKQSMTFNINKLGHKKSIEKLKIIIKSLKKQLPAPKEKIELIRGRYYMFVCSVCGASSVEGTYCPYCGQKLR